MRWKCNLCSYVSNDKGFFRHKKHLHNGKATFEQVILANKKNKKYFFDKHSSNDPNTVKSLSGTK